MDLISLLEVQTELNSLLNGAMPSRQDWEMALLCEVGELVDCLRDGMAGQRGWVWWRRIDRPPAPASREKVLEELADLLHFALAGSILGFAHLPEKDLSRIWERGWRENFQTSLPGLLQSLCADVDSPYVFGLLPLIVKALGFGREELKAAYLTKSEKNKKRWQEASENGLTVKEAQARERELDDGIKWLGMYLPGLPMAVRNVLVPLEEVWRKEVFELKSRLEKALELTLPE